MPDPDTIAESIEQSAIENVRRVSTGNVSIEGHSLKDQIEADKYFSGRPDPDVAGGAGNPMNKLRFGKFIPPGGGG